jgi:carbonic anhydrase/acetyltransferase-like protein (isoleucine patch superfamily)
VSTDGNMAHVMYDRGGSRISLFVLDHGGALDKGSELAQVETIGHKAILWTAGAATYVVVGTGAELMPVASWMREQVALRRRTDE